MSQSGASGSSSSGGDPPRLGMIEIGKSFGATVALDRVNFDVRPGEVHALVGENGAGKSTLMKILSGALQPDVGEMRIDGTRYAPRHPLDARHHQVGMIYQELAVAPHLTVEENILLGVEPHVAGWIKRREVRSRALEALAQFGHGEIRPDERAGALSVSQQQLIEIGRALALGCRILVFDEPTSSLGQEDIRNLFSLIERLKGSGIAIVYISHFLDEVDDVADRVTVLRDGRAVGTRDIRGVSMDEIVRMMVGRTVDELYPRSTRRPGDVALELRDLQGAPFPISASLELRRGEVLGICGLVGSGRTELLRAVFGLEPVRSGAVKIGMYSGVRSPKQGWDRGIGLLSEDRKTDGLTLPMSIADNVTMSRLRGLGPAGLVLPSRQRAASRVWIDLLDIRCRDAEDAVQTLSGGNQQKVLMARLLQHDVDVLLLDEPTRGIDVAAKAKMYETIDRLATGSEGSAPKAVLMVSSYLPELLGICDRIAVMYRGRLGPAYAAQELDGESLMRMATGQAPLDAA